MSGGVNVVAHNLQGMFSNRQLGIVTNRKAKSIEKSFQELDEILEQLEDEEVTLEDSFKLYQKGMKLVKECNTSIDKVEKELIVISEG